MTTQPSTYASLAAGSYGDIRKPQNAAPIPTGWAELTAYAVSGSGGGSSWAGSGFSAKVYRSAAGEIVISYSGTEFAASSGALGDFTSGNVPLANGLYGQQALEAAKLYQRVKAAEGGNITFTGHSLGGGLASVMAVWFDRPAYVFAAAPFQLAATRSDALSALAFVRAGLRGSVGGCDPALDAYDPAIQFAARESKVQAWAVKGEVLESTLGMFNWIEAGSGNKLINAGVTELGMLPKHSIDLHAAALLSPVFNEWAAKLSTALPRVFDSKLYAANPLSSTPDFLIKLNRNEVGVLGLAANGMLTHFGNDLQKLGTNVAGLNKAAQDALIAQGIEWYYWQGTDYAGKEFFKQTGELLQYTTATGAGLAGAQNKAASYVSKWLTPIVNDHGEFYSASFSTYDQWNVVTGGSGASLTALMSSKSQIFIGGAGGDSFTGGDLGDVMFAGAGNDTLKGGTGYDSYRIEGSDTIEDSDGIGNIRNKAGQRIAGAIEKRSDGSYVFLNDLSIIASVQIRTGELGKSRFKSNARKQRSCRTRKATARGHVPGHGSLLASATRNEALQ